MLAWVRRPFASWQDFFEFLVFLVVCLAGIVHASWLWIVIGAMLLLLLGWSRWSELIAKAGKVDALYRELGRLALAFRVFGASFEMYARAHLVMMVLGAKFLQDAAFLIAAYLFGMASAWLWGVDVGYDPFSLSGG